MLLFQRKKLIFILLVFLVTAFLFLIYFYPKSPISNNFESSNFTLEEWVALANEGNTDALQYLIASYSGGGDMPMDLEMAREFALKLKAVDPKKGESELALIEILLKAKNLNNSSNLPPDLELQSSSCEYKGGGYAITEGLITNLTDKPIEYIEAIVKHFTKYNDFITSDTALIEYKTLMPNQTSPFKIHTPYNPLMDNCIVSFKDKLGRSIYFKRK